MKPLVGQRVRVSLDHPEIVYWASRYGMTRLEGIVTHIQGGYNVEFTCTLVEGRRLACSQRVGTTFTISPLEAVRSISTLFTVEEA